MADATAPGGSITTSAPTKPSLKSTGSFKSKEARSITFSDSGVESSQSKAPVAGGKSPVGASLVSGLASDADINKADPNLAVSVTSGRRKRATLSKDSTARGSTPDTVSLGHYAGAIGMVAASSQAGGKGVNCTKFEGVRYDGRVQKEVIKELEDAVDELAGNQAMFKAKSPNLLSPFETISNRANDLSTWYGVECAPDTYSSHRDAGTGMVLVRYDGEFAESEGLHVREGNATVRASNGIVFEGKFEGGVMQGEGRVVFPSGNKWEGNFDNGRMHGEGTFTWSRPPGWPKAKPFSMKYQGWLQDGRIVSVERKSIFIFNKHVYEGELVDGCAHGSGVMLWPDGRWYDGEWNGGSPHGEGTLCMPDGDKKTGYFEPCNARWYAPLKVNKAFWPGQLDESEMLRVDKKLPPAQDRMR